MKISDENQDFNWAIGLNRFSLRLIGIWPAKEEIHTEPFLKILRIPMMILVMFFGLFLPQMYALFIVINQLPLVIENLMTSCATFTSCLKLVFIWQSRQVLHPVVESLTNDWLKPKLNWQIEIMRQEASRARFITIADYTIMASCYSGFVIAPLLGFNLRTINNLTDYGKHNLLVQSYYPYDYSSSPVFELTHFMQLLGSLFVGLAVSIPDDYFGALIFHASGQFKILGIEIERFVRKDGEIQSTDVHKELNIFIDRHVHLIKMVAAVEKSFGLVIAAQIFCMSIMVCCLGFQSLSMVNNVGDKPTPLQMVTLVGTLFTMMIHTFVNCFASETLASRSVEVFFSICNSKWYLLPYKSIRCLIPMMIVSKIPRQIRVGKILYMSMETYCSIIKSTAGYISMLIAVSGR